MIKQLHESISEARPSRLLVSAQHQRHAFAVGRYNDRQLIGFRKQACCNAACLLAHSVCVCVYGGIEVIMPAAQACPANKCHRAGEVRKREQQQQQRTWMMSTAMRNRKSSMFFCNQQSARRAMRLPALLPPSIYSIAAAHLRERHICALAHARMQQERTREHPAIEAAVATCHVTIVSAVYTVQTRRERRERMGRTRCTAAVP